MNACNSASAALPQYKNISNRVTKCVTKEYRSTLVRITKDMGSTNTLSNQGAVLRFRGAVERFELGSTQRGGQCANYCVL